MIDLKVVYFVAYVDTNFDLGYLDGYNNKLMHNMKTFLIGTQFITRGFFEISIENIYLKWFVSQLNSKFVCYVKNKKQEEYNSYFCKYVKYIVA